MSTKQDQEAIRLRAQRECRNLRVAMESRGCSEGDIEARCQELTKAAEERAQNLKAKDSLEGK